MRPDSLSRLRGRVPSKARRVGAPSANPIAGGAPPPTPPPQRGRGVTADVLSSPIKPLEKGSHYDRDVFHAWHLELADLRRPADGAGAAGAGGVPVLARARGVAGRAVVVRVPSVLAAADPDVRDFRR